MSSDVEDAQAVLETGMAGRGEHIARCAQLLEVAKTLELWGIDDGQDIPGNFDLIVHLA